MKSITKGYKLVPVAGLLFSLACGKAEESTFTGVAPATAHQQVRWSTSDRPSLLEGNLTTRFLDLPLEGQAENTPWTGSYWPTYSDSINYRWAGQTSLSPAEKFESAFEKPGLTERISKFYGIQSRRRAWNPEQGACTTDDQCKEEHGEICAKRRDADSGYCIPTWFGICHAWAPAAMMVPEPRHPVVHNGVEFKVNDIKALVSLSYTEGVTTKFMSLRCNERAEDIDLDEYGRPVEENRACADTNAGSFHIVVTNLLGLQGKAFIEDRTFDHEVWNQPVSRYQVTHYASVTAAKANELIGGSESSYLFNDDAVSFQHIRLRLYYIGESSIETDGYLGDTIHRYTHYDNYEYILELDTNDQIIGGEWVGSSKTNHPDFLWRPTHKADVDVPRSTSGSGITWHDVQTLLERSQQAPEDSTPAPIIATEFNTSDEVARQQWQHYGPFNAGDEALQATLSPRSGDPDLYLRVGAQPTTSVFDCRPYRSGTDVENCTAQGSNIFISVRGYQESAYDLQVTGIVGEEDESSDNGTIPVSIPGDDEGAPPSLELPSETLSVARQTWQHFGPFQLGNDQYAVKMVAVSGDPDLYIGVGSQPTASTYQCRPYLNAGQHENCTVTGEQIYISVHGYSASSFRFLTQRLEPSADETDHADSPNPAPATETALPFTTNDSLNSGEWSHYGPYNSGGSNLRFFMEALSGDPDLYVRSGAQPSTSTYDCRPYLGAGKNEECVVSGEEIYVSVRGYSVNEYRLSLEVQP